MTEKDDLAERLNNELGWGIGPALLCQEAATRLTELERQLAEAREALKPISKLTPPDYAPDDAVVVLAALSGGIIDTHQTITVGDLRRAARALSGKGE